MKDDNKKYDANFTAGGLLFHEFISLQQILLSDDFSTLIKIEEEENNLMAVDTLSARKRILSEVKRRFFNAPDNFWNQFYNWSDSEQKLGLFYLCLKTYPLILDLHFEVVIKKFKLGAELSAYDINMRLDELASVNEGVASWSSSTLDKINVQYRKMLKDVGIYNGQYINGPQTQNDNFWRYFTDNNESWFLEACFI